MIRGSRSGNTDFLGVHESARSLFTESLPVPTGREPKGGVVDTIQLRDVVEVFGELGQSVLDLLSMNNERGEC